MKLNNFNKNKIYNLLKKENGFSLVEMLLVVFIIAIVTTVISLLYISSVRSQRDLLDKTGAEANLRTTLYSLTKDIREATNVLKAENSSLKLTTDMNNDSVLEDVEYVLRGTKSPYTLNKIINGGNDIFVMDYIISNNIFSYYLKDGLGDNLSALLPDQLSKLILINLSFNVNKEPLAPAKAVILSTKVSLRNAQ